MAGLLTPARVDQSARMPGGVLSRALPAPSGWERGGLVIPFYGCGEPVLRDKCVAAEDTPHRDSVGEFHTVPIEQGATCSTSGLDSLDGHALDRFNATSDWALSRQLQTDQADTGSPKLDDASDLGTVADADVVGALACLEQAAADNGFGSAWVVHTTVRGVAYLAGASLLTDSGFTHSGAKVIMGTGYENPDGTTVRFWVTGQVWASISTPESVGHVAYATNDMTSWARGLGIAAFDPCINFSIDVTVPACPTPGS